MACVLHEGQCRLQLSTPQYGQLPDRQSPQAAGESTSSPQQSARAKWLPHTHRCARAELRAPTPPKSHNRRMLSPKKCNQAAHTLTAVLWQIRLQERKRDPVHMACTAASHQ